MPVETRTYDLAHVVKETGVPSEDWLRRKLRAGLIPGRLAGRTWRMTESDIAALVEFLKVPARRQTVAESAPASIGSATLTPRSQRKMQRHTA